MTTDEEKSKIAKLLNSLEVPDVKLTERCHPLVKEFQQEFGLQVEEEFSGMNIQEVYENPYKVDKDLLAETDKKLKQLLSKNKKPQNVQVNCIKIQTNNDPQRPWRTNTNKEKLIRIDSELKRHYEKSFEMINPLPENEMQDLVESCRDESGELPASDRLRETVEEARKNLPNFQYRKIKNSTATEILPNAHDLPDAPVKEPVSEAP